MRKMIVILFAGVLLLLICNGAWAQEQQGEVEKQLYHTVEYSDAPDDKTTPGSHNGNDPCQVILTTVKDIAGGIKPMDGQLDYDPAIETGIDHPQVDALANSGDLYFWAVTEDLVHLFVSFKGDPLDTVVWIEGKDAGGGHRGYWHKNDLSNVGTDDPDPNFADLDALETYGPPGYCDANMCSFVDDAVTDTSVWKYNNALTPPYQGWVSHSDICDAVNALGPYVDPAYIELDALMVSMQANKIIFSIVAAPPGWHGGELIEMNVNNPSGASWLFHGDHDWDHNFHPGTEFDVGTDDIDAIEAWNGAFIPLKVPALTNWGMLILLVLLVLSGVYVIYHRRKGVVRT